MLFRCMTAATAPAHRFVLYLSALSRLETLPHPDRDRTIVLASNHERASNPDKSTPVRTPSHLSSSAMPRCGLFRDLFRLRVPRAA